MPLLRLWQKFDPDRPRSRLDILAVVVLIVLCASWGLQQIAIKIAMAGISPVMQAGLRSLGASVLVCLWMMVHKNKIFTKDGTLGWGMAVGLIFSIEFVLIYWGLKFTYASRSVIFLNTMPFFTALGAQLFLPSDRLKIIHTAGLCCAFVGLLLAFSESIALPDRRMLIGDIMMISGAILWATATVLVKTGPLCRIPASKTLLYQLGLSAFLLPPCSRLLGEPGIFNLTPLVAACIIYQVLWVAFITYLAWFWLIKVYPATRISAFVFLTPLFGVFESVLLLGEVVTAKLFAALVLVCTGIYFVNRPVKRHLSQCDREPRS